MNSMGMIYELLCQIRQKYALYIGRKDVRRLGIFLSGYECALFDAMGFFPEFNGRFQQFVGKKLGMLHSSLHWTDMLLDGATEDEAFDKFYVLADEFFASEEEVSAEEIANTVNIDTIFSMLDWNAPETTQAQGRMLARNVRSINVFLQPQMGKHNKNVWDNCARILAERSDDELRPHLFYIFRWLQDMNWPGAWDILERLKAFHKPDAAFKSTWQACINEAKRTRDTIWLDNLRMLR